MLLQKWELASSPNESSTKWTRNEVIFYAGPGEVGNAIIRIYPQYNSSTVETHLVDNLELYHISNILRDSNADFSSVDNEDENYYQAEIPYLVNNSNEQIRFKVGVRDYDAYGLSNFFYSEAKGVLPSSGILQVDNVSMSDLDSARGVGAAYMRYFGRVRQIIKAKIFDAKITPSIGDLISIKMTRAPVSADSDNIWTITYVQVTNSSSNEIEITATRQVDPWIDRNKRATY